MDINDEVIDDFSESGGRGFLSNMHPSTIFVDGARYPTVEHAIQAHKSLDVGCRELIRRSPTAADAKRLGRSVGLRPDWEHVKVDLMRRFVGLKFENPFLRHLLVGTGSARLVYGNRWNDRFWGV